MARILIIDDEPLIAMLAEDWLIELGHSAVGPAHNLGEALKCAEHEIDGAVIDVNLGAETGYPVAKRLKQRGIPFVFATGHAKDSVNDEDGPSTTLTKPFEFEAFREAVDRMLADNRRA
jgi:CheY-like chemotaxis protein